MFIKLTSWLLLFFVLGPLAQAEDVAPDCPVVLASSETYQQQMAQMVWQENRVGQALEAWRSDGYRSSRRYRRYLNALRDWADLAVLMHFNTHINDRLRRFWVEAWFDVPDHVPVTRLLVKLPGQHPVPLSMAREMDGTVVESQGKYLVFRQWVSALGYCTDGIFKVFSPEVYLEAKAQRASDQLF